MDEKIKHPNNHVIAPAGNTAPFKKCRSCGDPLATLSPI